MDIFNVKVAQCYTFHLGGGLPTLALLDYLLAAVLSPILVRVRLLAQRTMQHGTGRNGGHLNFLKSQSPSISWFPAKNGNPPLDFFANRATFLDSTQP